MPRLLVPPLLLIAVAAAASCTRPETEAAAETAIRDILSEDVRQARSLASATAESQIASFEKNYAKGYLSVAATGTVYTLDDILRAIRAEGPNRREFDSVEMDDAQVRIHGDTAVATYVMTYAGRSEGRPFRSSIRESAVFVKRDERWLRIFEQRGNASGSRE